MVYTSLLVKGEDFFKKKFGRKISKKISFDGGCLEVGLWRGTGVSGWWNRGTGWKAWPLQRFETSVCSVANGLKGIYPMMEEKERSRKRGFFFVCVPIVLEVYTGMEQGTKGTSYNKGKTGVKTYAFQCWKAMLYNIIFGRKNAVN